jgi:hypothetical protein
VKLFYKFRVIYLIRYSSFSRTPEKLTKSFIIKPMRISTLHSIFRVLAIVLGISIASQASAKYFHNPAASGQFKMVNVEYTPNADFSTFGTFNTAAPVFSGILRVPILSFAPLSFCGGGRDSSGGDTTGGPGDDSLDGGDGNHGFGDGGHHDGDNDSTGAGSDTTGGGCPGGGHGGDSTNWANDTVDCGHHHGDTTVVTDTNTHTLFNGGRQSIVVKSHGTGANVVLQFTNNLTTSVTITNMSLISGKYFTIISGAPTTRRPVRLASGASITLKVAFNAADYVVHTDQLQVASNSSQTASTISLSGMQIAAASVSNAIPAGVSVTLLPNPMTSRLKVDLTGVSSASAVIFDINGKQVFTSPIASGEWIWNGTATDGSMLLSGTYIVRLTGMSAEGAPFISTQKIILAR